MRTFLEFLEANNNTEPYNLLSINIYTSGSYGFGDREEFPAEDPTSGYWIIDNQKDILSLEPYLKGNLVTIFDSGVDGSYHEKWYKLDVFVNLPKQIDNEIIPDSIYKDNSTYNKLNSIKSHSSGYGFKKHFLNYTTLDDLIKKIVEVTDLNPPGTRKTKIKPIEPKETSEDYWKKMIFKKQLPKPKSQWEGD